MGCYLCGFTHAYYMFDIERAESSFITIYRLALLGDFDLFSMEGQRTTFVSNRTEADKVVNGTGLNDESPEAMSEVADQGPYYWAVRALFLGTSFVVTISLMNIFIAVLSMKYEEASNRAETLFWQDRASAVLDTAFYRAGCRSIVHSLLPRCLSRRILPLMPEVLTCQRHADEAADRAGEKAVPHLWYCTSIRSPH
mmetsp:Transcript_82796/g.213303  ORF Transcript_82796/g.213303 Transcript_82796/m.213303 type:complete len:197 (+) Transcript_82796:1-591(+)